VGKQRMRQGKGYNIGIHMYLSLPWSKWEKTRAVGQNLNICFV
jgi:hypothetical protein